MANGQKMPKAQWPTKSQGPMTNAENHFLGIYGLVICWPLGLGHFFIRPFGWFGPVGPAIIGLF
jgi:hypothetical protein